MEREFRIATGRSAGRIRRAIEEDKADRQKRIKGHLAGCKLESAYYASRSHHYDIAFATLHRAGFPSPPLRSARDNDLARRALRDMTHCQ